ncbi:hypothetical protein FRC17_010362 [Serendipita sp. 399]|nr:hypothetical protein FRC17_010362 [Serendipita sp. 399]
MPSSVMEEAISQLEAQLKVMNERPNLNRVLSIASSPWTTTRNIILIERLEGCILKRVRELDDLVQRYHDLVASLGRRWKPGPGGSPVNRLPDEVVLEIFKALVEDGSHHLWPLLLVNTRFHGLVTSTPSLWCKIRIEVNNEFQESNRLSVSYIRSCLKYSRAAGLHVDLDLLNLPSPGHYASYILTGLELPESGHEPAVSVLIREVKENLDWSHDNDFYITAMARVQELVRTIIGPEGVHMQRWKSFKFAAPEIALDAIDLVWCLLKHPTPMLETFVLDDSRLQLESVFPDLAAVRNVILNGPLLRQASLYQQLVTMVDTSCDHDEPLFDLLAGFKALRELTIFIEYCPSRIPDELYFPTLKTLTLTGYLNVLENVVFRTPQLECLALDGWQLAAVNARARTVKWSLHSSQSFEWELLTKIEGIEELVVHGSSLDSEETSKAVSSIHEMVARWRGIPQSLRVVRGIRRGEQTLDHLENPKKQLLLVSSQSLITARAPDTISLIETFQQSIFDLSRTLNDAIQRYSTLVASLMLSHKRTISSLPNEMMLEIFQLLVSDGSHRLRPVLLVNKRTHALVTSAPSLWCKISIKFDRALQECNDLSVRYIETCIKNSRKFLLDVDLDMDDIPSPSECTASILAVVKKEVPRFSDVIERAIYLAKEIGDEDHSGAFFTRRLANFNALRRAIAGKEGVHMRRWRSFKFSSSQYLVFEGEFDPGDMIRPFFEYSMPNLEIFALKIPFFGNHMDPHATAPDLSSVRHLMLYDEYEFTWASFSRHLLMTAAVYLCDYDPGCLDIFSGCEVLEELTIDCLDFSCTEGIPEIPEDVVLPSLRKLTLGGDVDTWKHVTFCTPSP